MGETSASTSLRSQLVQAVIPPQHGASVGVQSSSGALKRLALKSKSETFSCVLPIDSHTQRFAVTVSFRRKLLTLRQLYPRAPSRPSVSPCRMGGTSTSTSLRSQLLQAVIPPQHDAFVGVQSSCGALKRLALKSKSETFSCVLPIDSHTQRFAVTVSFRRKLLTLRQLSHGQIIYFYFADVSARTSSDTASTWCVCGKRSTGCTFFNS